MTTTVKRTAIGALLLLILLLVGWTYLQQTSAHFMLDLNPAVEIEINRLNRVKRIEAMNEDGEKLLAGYKGEGKPMEDAISDIVDRLILQGFLNNREDNAVLLTARGTSDENTLHRIQQVMQNETTERNLRVTFLQAPRETDDALEADATKLGVSTGKLDLIRRVTRKEPTLNEQTLRNRSVRELLQYLDDDDFDDDRDDDKRARTERPVTERPKTEKPVTEAPRTEAPKPPAPATEAPRRYDDDDDWDDDWDDDDWDDDDWDDDDWDDDWDDDDWDDDDWDDDDWDDDDWDDDDWDDDDDDDDDWDDDDDDD